MKDNPITEQNIVFYHEMRKSEYGKPKKYHKLFKERDSDGYRKFILVYTSFRECLVEREKYVLDLVYGLNKEFVTLKEIGKRMGITSSRVAQLRDRAERNLSNEMYNFLNGNDSSKKSMYTIICEQPNGVLIEILKSTRPWEKNIQHFTDVGELSLLRRATVIRLLDRVWELDMLNQRAKIMVILGIDEEEIR